MISTTIILGVLGSLWGSGTVLAWLVRIGIVPFIPVLSSLAEVAFSLTGKVLTWLGAQLADMFEKPGRLVIMTLCFYGGAWHFADWRPWHGFSKEKAAIHRTVKAAPAPKVAAKRAQRKTDTKSIFERNFGFSF